MKNFLFFQLLIAVILFSFTSCDDDAVSPVQDKINTTAELSLALNKIITDTEVPGFAVSLVKDNSIVFQDAFGYADLAAQKAYTNQTTQHIASVSKTFVGAAVVKAIEQGLFTLESNINDLLPVEIVNPKQPNAEIKVKHLVSHTSGLLDNVSTYFASNYYILPGEDINTIGARALMNNMGIEQREGLSLDEFLSEYYLTEGDVYHENNFASTTPGASWAYSNVATGLMGFIIEYLSGMPFKEYVKTQILLPLEMNYSTYDIADVNPELMAKWYLDKDSPFPFYANDSYPEGSVFTNNIDFGKYLLDMINGGQGLSNALFSTNGYQLLFADQLPTGIVDPAFADNHGIFWIKQGDIIKHGGNSFGVSAYIELEESGSSGYSFMTNMDAVFDFSKYQEVATRVDEVVKEFLTEY